MEKPNKVVKYYVIKIHEKKKTRERSLTLWGLFPKSLAFLKY